MLESESKTPLQIGIVGAGVAGLAAAIALRRVGHECEVGGPPGHSLLPTNNMADLGAIDVQEREWCSCINPTERW